MECEDGASEDDVKKFNEGEESQKPEQPMEDDSAEDLVSINFVSLFLLGYMISLYTLVEYKNKCCT
jgi:hypothetical protein